MEFGVLGELEVRRAGERVPLGSYKQRSLLALLLIHANHAVSADRIIDELWSDGAASDRHNALWVHVSKLRGVLEPDRGRRTDGGVLQTRPPGYALRLADEELDAARFERLVQEGRTLLDVDPAVASVTLGEALSLWRGRPYEDFTYESFAQAEIVRLDELRLETVELRIDADLRRGLAGELVGELQALVRQHPFRERLTAQLMLALHRAGRRAEALRSYAHLRARLNDELGLDPSSEVQELEAQILGDDPRLAAASPRARDQPPAAVRGYELRELTGSCALGPMYRAYQPADGREVGITVVDPRRANDVDFIRRLQAETEVMSRLRHPNILTVEDFWRDADGTYLVTRVFTGSTLDVALGTGPLPPETSAAIEADVWAAVAAARDRGFVRDDAGPASILVEGGRGLVHGFDFALAPVQEAIGSVAGSTNPYKGLHAFGEADAVDFFGRQRVVERLLTRFGTVGSAGRFVAVVGPSGGGKSSVVRAGLIPAIRGSALPDSAGWFVVQMVPGHHPFEQLAEALRPIAADPRVDLLAQLLSGPAGLGQAVQAALPEDRSQLVLVVDQFEELFTLADPTTGQAFLDALAAAVLARHGRLRVVITLRADFYDRPLEHHAFGELLRRGTEVVSAMAPEELQQAIEGPAARLGVRFEPGLVAAIVSEITDHAGGLPLLQYALTELFDLRRGDVIDAAAYRELGGAVGALARRADVVYQSLDEPARAATRQVMLRLVSVGDGEEVTRRRVLRQELTALGDDRVPLVLDTFGRHRLLAFDRDPTTRGPTVEIAHEALFREWARLRSWIADSRDDVRRRLRLTVAAEEWRATGEAPDYLLQGARLDEVAAATAHSELRLTTAEREFLDASVARREADRAAERARRTREGRLRRRSRRRTVLLVGSAVALVAASTVAVSEVRQRQRRDEASSTEVEIEALAGAGADVAADDPQLGTLLALQSLAESADAHLPADVKAEEALHWAVQAEGVPYPSVGAPVAVREGPNGLTGVYEIPLADLVAMGRGQLSRGFSPEECAHYDIDPCPPGDRGLTSPAATGQSPLPAAAPLTGGPPNLAGTKVTLVDGWHIPGLKTELQRFQEMTGIVVDLVSDEDLKVIDRLPDGGKPDVTVSAIASAPVAFGNAAELLDLSAYLDVPKLRQQMGDQLVDFATSASGLTWLPLSLDMTDLVWYRKSAFAAAGYQVPTTLGELEQLTHRMIADGHTPWCLGAKWGEDPEAGGWPLTDWLEALIIRTGGTQLYDRWAGHDVAFDDLAIRSAGPLLDDLLQTTGAVLGGADSVDEQDAWGALGPVAEDPPRCWMARAPTYTPNLFPVRFQRTGDLDYFRLPPVDGSTRPATVFAVSGAAARTDRPEVRELMRYFAGRDWGLEAAQLPIENFIPARAGLQVGQCVDPQGSLAYNTVRVRLCQDVRAALASGDWRFDASNGMPPAVSGAFLAGMVDYLNEGPGSLDHILHDIDAAWRTS
jgi:DNA-binding SARP family transcriptional activator/ABC-type glycerol-3-phosphate transport system substrate-binding protein